MSFLFNSGTELNTPQALGGGRLIVLIAAPALRVLGLSASRQGQHVPGAHLALEGTPLRGAIRRLSLPHMARRPASEELGTPSPPLEDILSK